MRDHVYVAGEGQRITRGEIGVIYEQHGERIPDHLRSSFGYMAATSSVYVMNGPIDIRTLVGLLKTTMPPEELHDMIRDILAANVSVVAKKCSVGIIPRDLLPRIAKVYRRHNLIERIDFEEVLMKEPIEYAKYIRERK